MRLTIFLLVTLLCLANLTYAVETSNFKPTTTSAWEKSLPSPDTDITLDMSMPELGLTVLYTGKVRSIGSERLEFLKRLSKVSASLANVGRLYADEISVTESGKAIWIPVQREVRPFLAKELKPGQQFKLYVRFCGFASKTDPVYLAMDFDSPTTKN